MTTLISWIGVDHRKPSSLYLASDSRISWGSERHRWDAGRKLFACRDSFDIFGYCGDVLFPALALGQFIEAVDRRLIFVQNEKAHSRHDSFVSALMKSFQCRHHAPDRNFYILHAARQGAYEDATFQLWQLKYEALANSWTDEEIELPTCSGLVVALGSGGSTVKEFNQKICNSPQGKTSRAVFWAFCDALNSGRDPLSGGAPQLVGLYRKDAPKSFGVLYGQQRYFLGLPLDKGGFDNIEWRDELFQCISSENSEVIEGTQRHGRY